jgi:hypothetical protein
MAEALQTIQLGGDLISGHSDSFRQCPLHPIPGGDQHVRFVPCADGSGLARTFFTLQHVGRRSQVFGLLVRHCGPLAIMPSADQVPIRSTHSTMRWHKWVCSDRRINRLCITCCRPPNFHITPDVRRDLNWTRSEGQLKQLGGRLPQDQA